MIRHPPKSTFFPYTPLFQSICKACKDKLVPNMAPSSSLQVAGAAVGSSSPIPNHFSRGETVAKTANFWRRMLKGKQRSVRNGSPDRFTSNIPVNSDSPDTSVLSNPPESVHVSLRPTDGSVTIQSVMEKSDIVSKPLRKSTSRVITPEPIAPRWSARRDATAHAALNVT